jgi:hypothetical protein
MGRPRRVFTFRCGKGHQFDRPFPLNVKLEDEDETTCEECLKTQVLETAYVVDIRFEEERRRERRNP